MQTVYSVIYLVLCFVHVFAVNYASDWSALDIRYWLWIIMPGIAYGCGAMRGRYFTLQEVKKQQVAYICDGRGCTSCNIEHAANFIRIGPDKWIEKE